MKRSRWHVIGLAGSLLLLVVSVVFLISKLPLSGSPHSIQAHFDSFYLFGDLSDDVEVIEDSSAYLIARDNCYSFLLEMQQNELATLLTPRHDAVEVALFAGGYPEDWPVLSRGMARIFRQADEIYELRGGSAFSLVAYVPVESGYRVAIVVCEL
ncbi:hypothetical protein [Mucisphaera sp.]|uniref:hypothetical protein n=1 Tax=Mucisphaera sp. TaxID=2913024 RepID=UPI003D0D074C